jgi:sulfate transport system permease protein
MSRFSTTNTTSSAAFAVASLLALLALVTLALKTFIEWKLAQEMKALKETYSEVHAS